MGVPRKRTADFSTKTSRVLRAGASLAVIAALFLVAAPLFAGDTRTIALGTGSLTGAVTAASPAASGVGKWHYVTGTRTDSTYLTFQLSAVGSTTILIQASLDGTAIDTTYTFTADNQIYKVAACGGCLYRAICSAYTSGSPVVTVTVSGQAQVGVQP